MGHPDISPTIMFSLYREFPTYPTFLCCIGLLVSGSISTKATASIQEGTDQFALLQLKSKITDDPLGFTSTWNESISFCQWQGVTCSHPNDRVTTLDLNSKQLAGSLSPYIGNLSFLKLLDLHNNSLGYEIPQEIGRLRSLEKLSLENNSFAGQIPANISQCINLVYLGLGGNDLKKGIPVEIGSLTRLQVLFLYRNSLNGVIPSSIGNLTSLQVLSLESNDLEGSIPSTLGQLANLSALLLDSNKLSGTIPPSVYNLSQLTTFSGGQNQIHGTLPQNLASYFSKLKVLALGTNFLSGNLPTSLSNASHLVRISMAFNGFTGKVPSLARLSNLRIFYFAGNNLGNREEDDLDFLPELVNCTKLEVLAIYGNNLGGVLPELLSNFSRNLQKMGLGRNHIRGNIPREIGNLINLDVLYLGLNQLTGSIPISIGKLTKLGYLNLSINHLCGSIPPSIGNLTRLFTLTLGNNNLEGSIPTSLGDCHNFFLMDLSHNKLEGIIPKQIMSSASTLVYLILSQNQLNGSLPIEVGKLPQLMHLDVSTNKLSGEVPSTVSSCTSLELLRMKDNLLYGTIPKSLSALRGLRDLDLSQNNFSGEIPKFLADFVDLNKLNLSFNEFEGEVPSQGVFKNATAVSIVGNKKLCGGILQLRLPSCSDKGSQTQRMTHKLIVLISFLCVVVGIILIVGFSRLLGFCRKKRKEEYPRVDSGRLSYQSLHRATGGFSSTNLIGEGSFGYVYKGFFEQAETFVAVKVFKLEHKGGFNSFMAECEAMRNIRHKNLVKILTACSSLDFQGNDFKALVYEFMGNGSLEEWLHPIVKQEKENAEPKMLSLQQRLNIAIEVGSAIDYLHNQGHMPIIHCDLKPTNVLLDGEMTAHIGDFGLARVLPEATRLLFSEAQTSSLGIKGTVGYAAPEYGMGSEVSTYGDVYSYGILILEMFTGKRPTDGIFVDGFNLHKFAKAALPERVMEIVDPRLLNDIDQESGANVEGRTTISSIQEYLILVLKIGIACSVEQPIERIGMNDVVKELHLINKVFIGNDHRE